MRPGDKAWLALAAHVVVYEFLADDGELLSEAADRYMLTHPWLTRAVALMVAGHVCNLIPSWADPLHLLFGRSAWVSRLGRAATPTDGLDLSCQLP